MKKRLSFALVLVALIVSLCPLPGQATLQWFWDRGSWEAAVSAPGPM